MIDIKSLENTEALQAYKTSLQKRNFPLQALDEILTMNQKRKELIASSEALKAEQNKLSQEVGALKRSGQDASAVLAKVSQLAAQVKEAETQAAQVDAKVLDLTLRVPNQLNAQVPLGKSSEENKEVHKKGSLPHFNFVPKEHGILGEQLKCLDSERGAKVAGARFTFLTSHIARLERSLIQFMMDVHSDQHGYREVIPPYIVNSNSLTGTGNFPKFKEDVFKLEGQDYYLIPTAEVPVTNFFAGEMLSEEQLPQRFCAFSPCFRSEAGSYGKDTKGLIRQHQFHKIELMIFAHPDKSYELHEELTSHAERILELLKLPYRRMLLCGGDTGFSSSKTYDLEVWLPGQNAYREISSCSNFEDFQARRANIRFRPNGGGKPRFVHTINGSGLAVGRTLVAILENYQKADGSIDIPEVLVPYMGGKKSISNS